MQINWEEAINQIFADRLVCPRCGQDHETMIIGYSRKPSLNPYAPRHRNCPRGEECEARKLITLCGDCARIERLRGTTVDATQALETYMLDCRRDLEESLDYLAEYWRDDIDLADEDLDRENDEKTSSVHFVRFEFKQSLREAILAGASVKLGCDHTNYPAHVGIAPDTLASLAGDLK